MCIMLEIMKTTLPIQDILGVNFYIWSKEWEKSSQYFRVKFYFLMALFFLRFLFFLWLNI